jgi:tetratricopeptide (TPR) repeat protein
MKPNATTIERNPRAVKSTASQPVVGAAIIILLAAVSYFPALQGQFVWDDDSWTTNIVGLLRNFAGLRTMWIQPFALQQYYPLAGTTFWLDYHLWGFWPLPYHVENILLHTLSSLFFWRLLKKLQVPGAWLASAIFAIHAVMVETVAWITERKNVLSMVLFLSAMLLYGQFTSFWSDEIKPVRKREAPRKKNWVAYGLAFVFFVGALLSKTTVFAFPAVVLLICWWKRGRIRWTADVLPTLPFFVVSIGFCLTTAHLEKYSVGAKGPEWDLSFAQRCLIAGRVFWFYIHKLIWPARLCFIYPRWQVNAFSWWQWLFPISAVGTLLILWMQRQRIGRGPLAAALFYVGTLFPVLGFMNAYFMRYSFVCDHWTYLSSLSIFALAAALLAHATERLRAPKTMYGYGAIVLAIFIGLTRRQCLVYADLETLWRDTLAKNPNAWLAHNNLGIVLRDEGKIPQAIEHYREAIRLNPNYELAYNNLGVALKNEGKVEEAIVQYQLALKANPRFPNAYYNLGVAQAMIGKNDDAIQNYQQAIGLDPNFFEPRYALAGLFMDLGRIPEAEEQYAAALKIDPGSIKTHNKYGMALAQQDRFPEAIDQWNDTLKIEPDNCDAHYNLGLALEKLGRNDEAIAQYEDALRIRPDFFQPQFNLGMLLMQQGKIPEAIDHLSDAVKIQPDSAAAQDNLALLLCQTGQTRDAIAHWDSALAVQPDYPEAQNGLAWLLATLSPQEGGDPARAVTLAEKACDLTGHQVPGYLDTLATAYASAGRFNDAIATDEKALALAQSAGQSQLAGEIQARLQLFQAGRAFGQSHDATTLQSN